MGPVTPALNISVQIPLPLEVKIWPSTQKEQEI